MTETTKNAGEKLSVTSTKTLTLKRGGVEQGVVRQSFSHGRSKAVVVEKVKAPYRRSRRDQARSRGAGGSRRDAQARRRHRQIAGDGAAGHAGGRLPLPPRRSPPASCCEP